MEDELLILHGQVLSCTKCELHTGRKNAVPGEGPSDARIVLVGEGPGEREDEEGRPFVGVAGKLLTELLESIGLDRSQVFITNIVKCRPPNNRPPRRKEIDACNPYLEAQIRLIAPRIICPLGTPAIQTLMGPGYGVGTVHGKPFRRGQTVFLPLYHPAAALYDASLKKTMLKDFQVLRSLEEGVIQPTVIPLIDPGRHGRKEHTLQKQL